jgi:glycosyltransferase involved in cell wall biosynthesis
VKRVSPNEEIDERHIARARHREHTRPILMAGDAAANIGRRQQCLREELGTGGIARRGIGPTEGKDVRMGIEPGYSGGQPAGIGDGIVVDESQNLPFRLGNGSISSSCGITICHEDVSNAGPELEVHRRRGDQNQFKRKRRFLTQHRLDRALRVAADPLHRHDDSDFHRMKLIVQIPAFNEEATIAQTLRDIPKKIDGIVTIETLVVDDGSSDQTAEAARKAGATHVVQLKTHRGLASAFLAGINAALRLGADIIVNTDADNQYAGADIPKLIAPIVRGTADVVIGDREVSRSPHMSGFKRLLQRLGSRTVGLASGIRVNDVTSGFRAFSREAAMQINVFNPFTYTLETVIQAGNRNLGVQSVPVRTNAPTRPSRLYHGIGNYLRKSIATIFRIYTVYKPLKTFFAIGALLLLAGSALGIRFLWHFAQGDRGGHVQSLILAAVFLIAGFQTLLIGLVADLISVNRRLSEEVLVRLKRMEAPVAAAERRPQPQRPPREPHAARPPLPPRRERAAETKTAATQWVWLLDEEKLQDRVKPEAPETDADDNLPSPPPVAGGPRRRRRRRGGRPGSETPTT